MTNEELAIGIQQGTAHYGELWEQVRLFVYQQANRYHEKYREMCERAGVELDDLIQSGFLALYDAVGAFDSASGYTFLAYMGYPLKNRWGGLVGLRGRKDPLDCAASLDKPLGDHDNFTLADTVEDERAEDDFRTASEGVYNDQLHEALNKAMAGLEPSLRDVLTQRFYRGRSVDEIACSQDIKPERVRTMQRNALCKMRRPPNVRYLLPFRDEIISCRAYCGVGLQTFRNSGTSSVERIVEYLEQF